MGPVLSVVAPAYNEERNLPAFIAAIIPVLEGIGEPFELIFVNDGSRDNTLGMLAAAASQDPRIKVVGLARNFGKDIALSAGLAHATGQAVIPIDCDLQHPVDLIPAFVAKWREGYDMVLGVRSKRDEEGFLRRSASRAYYKVMRWMTSVEIPANAGDFRLIDRKIIDVINQMPERHRFMKGIFAWPGFKVTAVEFQANVRANETQSTWSFFKLWRFALDGLFSFSTAPLKMWTYVGIVAALAAFAYLTVTVVQKLFFGIDAPGYASLLIVVLFFNALLLISNGIQGEYIARIFEEAKGRPLFVVGQKFGFGDAPVAQPGAVLPVPTVDTLPYVAGAPGLPGAVAAEEPKPAPRRELPKPTKPPPLPRIGQ
ncbi:MAG: glycosyltransferase family 2 protein [Myxococcota bacterium]|nr:glycosyltransferase family 2 protein [Myxococcota bacterium]